MEKPTVEQIKAYQAAFDHFNKELFGDELPDVILNFSRYSRAKAVFIAKEWASEVVNAELHEISLCPKFLFRNQEEVFSSLVHEMAHLWQQDFGHPPRRCYHNKEWASKMLEVGLTPVGRDGKITGQHMTHEIMPDGPFQQAFQKLPEEALLPWRVFHIHEEVSSREGKSGVKFKYSCPGCNTNIWGKEGISVVCSDCEMEFRMEEKP